MNQQKLHAKQAKARVIDILYLVSLSLIIGVIISNLRLQHTINLADSKIQEISTLKEVKAAEITPSRASIVVTKADDRVDKLRTFLQSKKSPLAPYSEIIVSEADKYDIGYTKLASISGMESSFGTRLPDGSHNAWGIGGSNFVYFKTWEEGIEYTSWLMGTKYKQNEYQAIKQNYCPSSDGCNPAWAATVVKNSKDILAIGG